MISIYLDVPLNLKQIYIKCIDTIKNTYILTDNKLEANLVLIYPYSNNVNINSEIINNKNHNLKYINNFYKENDIFLFREDYIKNSFMLMDYLYENDFTYNKYLLYQLNFNNKNYHYLEKIMMLNNNCKWLIFDKDYKHQKIIYNFDEIILMFQQNETYNDWRIQKMLLNPAIIDKKLFTIKCYVIFIKKGKKYETLFHKDIIIEINDKKYLAKNYFEYIKIENYYYKTIYKQIINILINTSNIFDKLFKPFYNLDKTTCYQILEYNFHLSSEHKLYINNINIVPTIKWASLIYKINCDLFSYFNWGYIAKHGLIKINNNKNILKINEKNSIKNNIITFFCIIFLIILIINIF